MSYLHNYSEDLEDDIWTFIEDNDIHFNIDNFNEYCMAKDALVDDILNSDLIGNISGSYCNNKFVAFEYVTENELLWKEAIEESGIDGDFIKEHLLDWELWDVIIREYMLPFCVESVLDELCIDKTF